MVAPLFLMLVPFKNIQLKLIKQLASNHDLPKIASRIVGFLLLFYPLFFIIGNGYFGSLCLTNPEKVATQWLEINNGTNNISISELNLITLWGFWQINCCIAIGFMIPFIYKFNINAMIVLNFSIVLQYTFGMLIWADLIDHSIYLNDASERRLKQIAAIGVVGMIIVFAGIVRYIACPIPSNKIKKD